MTANPGVTLTQNGSGPTASYTVTPVSGFYGMEAVEVTAVVPISGTFELQVGSLTTQPINFDSTDLAATANNIQAALDALTGLGTTTVTAESPTTSPSLTNFSFDVTFNGNESPVTYCSGKHRLFRSASRIPPRRPPMTRP